MESYPTPFPDVTIPKDSFSFKLETAIEPLTAQMNQHPLRVNHGTWAAQLITHKQTLQELTQLVHDECGDTTIRPHAPADAAKILIDKMGLKHPRPPKDGKRPSMDSEVLAFFEAQGVEIAGMFARARTAQTCLSQVEAWEPYAKAGQVQAKWLQTGTPHGRYACEEPNLQNRIHPIRHTVEAPEGYSFLSLDLGQAEYVSWASLSGDQTLQRAFKEGIDFHRLTWEEIHDADNSLRPFGRDERDSGKTINFAILYLMKAFSLAKTLGCDVGTAQHIINIHRTRAPRAHEYIQETLDNARANGCVITTMFGRARHLPDLRSGNESKRHQANKTAWNHHNAGTAAEALKLKQYRAGKALQENFRLLEQPPYLALQMHDEVIFAVPDVILDDAKGVALEAFEKPIKGLLPFKTDVRTGKTWGDITK